METKPKKYIAMWNNIPLPFDNIEVFARKIFDFKVVEREGGFDVYELGKVVARYGMSYETKEKVTKDYLNCFVSKYTRKNLHFYALLQ